MGNVDTPWDHGDTTPPFAPGPPAGDESTDRASKGLVRVAAEAFAVGVAAAILGGSTLGWLLHGILAADCYGDGWCELGAAVYGVGLGVLVGCVVYVVAGVITIRRHRREGNRLTPSLIHATLPIGLVILGPLASFVFSFIS